MKQWKVETVIPYYVDVEDYTTQEEIEEMGEKFANEALKLSDVQYFEIRTIGRVGI